VGAGDQPLLELAIAHEQVPTNRRAAATAEMRAAGVVADADVTTAALSLEKETAETRHAEHDRRRREVTAILRRAQAHRLRMQVRAAKLRAEAAKGTAAELKKARDEAARNLAAWQLVADVIAANKAKSEAIQVSAQVEAAEKETSQLHEEETRHRRDLARLLTHRRDRAAADLTAASQHLREADENLKRAEADQQKAVAEHATATEQLRKAQEDTASAAQTITDTVTAGLLPEDTDPATHDTHLAGLVQAARQAHHAAEEALKPIRGQISAIEKILSSARQRAQDAGRDASDAERHLREVIARVHAIIHDERLLAVVSDAGADPWGAQAAISDALRRSAETADAEAAQAREAAATAQRTINAVGSDGLLPAAEQTEDAVHRCQDVEVPAWPGWRWLADTMTPSEAAAFAKARPEIASGVVISTPALLDKAAEAIGAAELDTAIWVGVVTRPTAPARREAAKHSAPGQVRGRKLVRPAPGGRAPI
jgi:myosin heavy subunit